MKINSDFDIEVDSALSKQIQEQWVSAASKLSLEHGVHISTMYMWEAKDKKSDGVKLMKRIYFKAGDHEFDSLNDLRKALKLKAFL